MTINKHVVWIILVQAGALLSLVVLLVVRLQVTPSDVLNRLSVYESTRRSNSSEWTKNDHEVFVQELITLNPDLEYPGKDGESVTFIAPDEQVVVELDENQWQVIQAILNQMEIRKHDPERTNDYRPMEKGRPTSVATASLGGSSGKR